MYIVLRATGQRTKHHPWAQIRSPWVRDANEAVYIHTILRLCVSCVRIALDFFFCQLLWAAKRQEAKRKEKGIFFVPPFSSNVIPKKGNIIVRHPKHVSRTFGVISEYRKTSAFLYEHTLFLALGHWRRAGDEWLLLFLAQTPLVARPRFRW